MTTVAALIQARDSLGDPGDVPQTTNAQNRFWAEHSAVTNRINAANRAEATLAKLEPLIAADTTWLAFMQTARPRLVDEAMALHTPDRPRLTDKEHGRLANLKMSIQVLDRGRGVAADSGYGLETLRLGELMREAGFVASAPVENAMFGLLPWAGCIAEVQARLAERQQRRDEAARQLADALRDPVQSEAVAS